LRLKFAKLAIAKTGLRFGFLWSDNSH
jgi:hypothetical protein